MREFQVFLGFANFYWRFIQSFSKIAKPFTLMLQTSSINRSSKNLLLSIDVAESGEVCGGGIGDCEDGTIEKSLHSKNLNGVKDYLTPNAK